MARYIDADALIEYLDVGHLRHPSELCYSELDVVNMLNHAPTAYSVESVVEKLDKRKKKLFDRCVHGVFDTIMAEVENIVRNGGKEQRWRD